MTKEQLLQQAQAKYDEARVIQKQLEEEKRAGTSEEIQKIEGLLDEALNLSDQVKKLDSVATKFEAMGVQFNKPAAPHPVGDGIPAPRSTENDLVTDAAVVKAMNAAFGIGEILSPADAVKSAERNLFTAWLKAQSADPIYGLYHREFSPYEKAFLDVQQKALSRLSDPDGGYLVSEDRRQELIRKLADATWIRKVARIITTTKSKVTYPSFEFTPTVSVVKDGETITPEDLTNIAGKLTFEPHSMAAIVKIPWELLDDSDFNLIQLLVEMYAERKGEVEEGYFVYGTGVEQPLGILSTSGITAVDVETATSAEITVNDVQGLPYNLKAAYRSNARWLMNRTYMKKAMLLRDDSGGSGTGLFMWQRNFQAGEPPTLAGYPVMETEFWPTVSADGDAVMAFGDFSFYTICDRKAFVMQKLVELYAASRHVGILMDARVDGGLRDVNAFVRLNRT